MLHPTEFAVRRPQFTLLAFFLLIVVGLVALRSIPRADDPQFPIPTYLIAASYPGASPADLERLFVDPLEERVGLLDDLKAERSFIEDGRSLTAVEFFSTVDVDRKYDEVMREVDLLRQHLPQPLMIDVRRVNTSHVPIAQLAVVSNSASYDELAAQVDRLERQVRSVKGVRMVETWGLPQRQLQVVLDPAKLEQLHIPLDAVLGSLSSANQVVPGGTVDIGRRTFNVRTSGAFASLDEVKDTVLAARETDILHLRDVAKVGWGYEDAAYITRYNGQRAIFLTVQQKTGQNIFDVMQAVTREIETFRQTLPKDIKVEVGFDQSENVSDRLGGLLRDFFIALALVIVTLMPLGSRAALIVMVAVPLSLAMGVAGLYFSGQSVNQLSIVGFVIALGLLVDDSIVVLENVTRFIRDGVSRDRAAIEAAKQIGPAVIGCTATLIIAFVPLMFLPDLTGRYLRSMPLAVVFTIVASFVVAMTIIPFLSSRLLRERDLVENPAYHAMQRFIEGSYKRFLAWGLARPRVVALGSAGLFVLSLALLPIIGFSFFPKAGIPQFRVVIETPTGSSFAETERAVKFVEEALAKRPGISALMSNIGGSNPQIYYNVLRKDDKRSNIGEVIASIESSSSAAMTKQLDELRTELADYPSAMIEVREFENGPPVDAPIAIRLSGSDLGDLRRLATQVESVMRGTEGTRDVYNPVGIGKTDLRIRVDRDRAGLVHVQEANIERAVRMAISGLAVSTFRETSGDERPIVVSLPRDSRQTVRSLRDVTVSADSGAQVPLSQLATLELDASPALIQHFDRQRTITVQGFVRSGYITDRVTTQILSQLEQLQWPIGMKYMAAGEYEARHKAFANLFAAIFIACCCVLLVLVLEFRTFRYTLIVASIVPVGMTGGLVALLISGHTLSFTAFVGFVALVGVDVKNSLLIVDFTNRLRAAGMPLHDAVRHAGKTRFFPVLLTSMTAIGGLMPLVLEGSSLYSPLAVVLMGGLISSTLLARVVEPVMYTLLAERGSVAREEAMVPVKVRASPPIVTHIVAAPVESKASSGRGKSYRKLHS